ncbi:penicillin acylase family protein [Mucilaginibacter sp. BJC16-A38]|uniref:penicillin acylase family protein n=1 Tax=Mucilaginibacter phenanthrenivorans TaxID=1234842 RepID=UPI002157F5BF|nr:penicillin acylase family protein [Mucilaginibacter phenanthrenivorans]MCR8561316.1 penicillin acylase family protein [Mucilaginibacter phenanthrenivorans]
MKFIKAAISIIITVTIIVALETKIGEIPALGVLLNPSTGFWQNAESRNILPTENLKIDGLRDPVIVRYDEHRIPHIFAKNDHDLYYAQGFITARDRLWQMDIQTRSASGRLSEVVGPKALEIDRYHRRMGMVYGAEKGLRGVMADPQTRMVVNAYTDGVNSYIHSLSPKSYPLEFKLLDYAPEDWKPINCIFLLKLMSETLAGGSDQFAMTNNLRVFGAKDVNDLFPDYPFNESPIIPVGTKWNFKPLPIPKPSKDYVAEMTENIKPREKVDGIGSNNWAITGSKSATGYPILANDPHLNLTFPAIWYQIQMSSPTVNVNGVSLPGAPCVIIGYNQKISWGVTNVDADVLDWYQVKFKDKTKNEYWYNNKWNPVKKRIEVIKVLGMPDEIDTVLYTHHGPVVYETPAKKPKGNFENIPVGDALRWIAHDESNEFMTFYLLNRGRNYADYRDALTYFSAPAQNFIFASNDNDIAITPNGKFPLKFKEQGKYIMDGSDTTNDWHGWIPADQNPTVKNPPRGFVSSANQSSTDPSYPYYINWRYEQYYRGKRINDRLGAMQKATVDSMRLMQMDNYSILAQDVLPTMLKYIDPTKLSDDQAKAFTIVKKWDKHYAANSVGASIFNNWWGNFYNLVWTDNFSVKGTYLKYPSFDRTEKLLLTEPNSKWFDDVHTAAKESCADMINHAFYNTVDDLVRLHGKTPGDKWQWGVVKQTYINHLASLPGFGTGLFSAGGRGGVINALRDNNGPSWRMVVQMGPTVKGFGVFPGGESGNPGSFFYKDMFETWRDGKLNELLFLNSAEEKSDRIKSTLTLGVK